MQEKHARQCSDELNTIEGTKQTTTIQNVTQVNTTTITITLLSLVVVVVVVVVCHNVILSHHPSHTQNVRCR